ncbi:MAG TPA: NAD(P)-dependent oxidoreductase [Clostridiales bacterium]|nr:NAD(P)-dependent oxidoreductase [Clostridiales bacterium]
MMKKAAITGATGMLASALIEKLVQDGVEVLAICRPHSKKRNHIPKSSLVTVAECDLSELLCLTEAGDDFDTFYHFGWDGTYGASRDDVYLQNNNITWTLDAVKLAHALGCQVFVGAGSQAEYGRATTKLKGDTPAFPESGYGVAKHAAGILSRIFCGQLGMRHNWGRILSTYGPKDNGYTMIMKSIDQMLDRKDTAFTKGEQQWDYLFSEDAANAFYCIGEKGIDGKVYPVGGGETRLLKEYVEVMRDAVDLSLPIKFGEVPYQPYQVMYLCADISELTADTGFEPHVPFEEGIQKTINWCRRERKK